MGNKRKEVEILDTFTDDHELCLLVRVDNVLFTLWWTNREVAAALSYHHDSPSARVLVDGLVKLVREKGQQWVNSDDDDDDERNTEWGVIGSGEAVPVD